MSKKSKADRSDRNRKMILGVQKRLAGATAILIKSVSYTPAAAVKVLQGSIDAADATAAAAATFHKATAAEREANAAGDALYLGLKTYLTNQYALQPEVLADFGIEIANRQAPDATTVAEAVAKRADTRAARHTMGKRQKAAVKGTSEPKGTTPAAPASPASPAAATPTTPKAS
jgi:hypothetical protein